MPAKTPPPFSLNELMVSPSVSAEHRDFDVIGFPFDVQ
jgi:hypothetical protein